MANQGRWMGYEALREQEERLANLTRPIEVSRGDGGFVFLQREIGVMDVTKLEHDRLDLGLTSTEFAGATCGSPNAQNGKAVYCGPNCPTLRQRIQAGEDASVPTNAPAVEPPA